MLGLIIKYTDTFLKRAYSDTLSGLLRQALTTGNRDNWLVFLDALEEKEPILHKVLVGNWTSLFNKLKFLATHFPESGIKLGPLNSVRLISNICNFTSIVRDREDMIFGYPYYFIELKDDGIHVDFKNNPLPIRYHGKLMKAHEASETHDGKITLWLMPNSLLETGDKVNKAELVKGDDGDFERVSEILHELLLQTQNDWHRLGDLFAI